MTTEARDIQREGLWRNCRDSITHALEHFSPVSAEAEPFHNRKWVILSVAHAAEVYCNLLLSIFDTDHPNGDYPSLKTACRLLKRHDKRLTRTEQRVIQEFLLPLADQRNDLMHLPAPEMLSASDTAIALLSLLHIIRRRTGVDTEDFFGYQDPPVEQDIFREIDWRKHDAWLRVAEQLAMEEYGQEYLVGCDNCGAFAVPSLELSCLACFEPANYSDD